MEYAEIFIVTLISFVVFCNFFRAKNGLLTNWPLVGMVPGILRNAHRVHDFFIELMEKSQMSFQVKAPRITNSCPILTVDPANINHVFSKNFEKYGKGPNFNEIFEVLGDGIFNADDALWEYHRKLVHSFFNHPKFQSVLVQTIHGALESSLMPLFDHVSRNGIEIDLQDVFRRFTLDNICTILMSHNPKFLSVDLPPIPFAKAVADLEEVISKRHLVPPFIWKSLMWLGIGKKKYQRDCQIVDDFLYMLIEKNRAERRLNNPKEDVEVRYDFLKCIDEQDIVKTPSNKKGDEFLRDTIFSLIVAGVDTTSVSLSWFFYIISKYPQVSTKIREELNTIITQNKETFDGFLRNFDQYKNKLVYLHASICETLRLYPPVAFNHKSSMKSDILPSGHQLNPDTHIIIDIYAMGRMKSIWGDDCAMFKPERWITKRGNIKLEPSYKFLSFGAGPRICQGKDLAFNQLKIVISAIILKYDIELVEGHEVVSEFSVILHMKHGLKVKIKHYER